MLLNDAKTQDSWLPEEKNSIRGQRRGLISQSFSVIKFYLSIKEIGKASDIGIRRGQKEYLLVSVNNEVIYSPVNQKKKMSGGCKDLTRPTPIIYILR